MKQTIFTLGIIISFVYLSAQSLYVNTVEQGPVIDGNIDMIYSMSDSITDFTMSEPVNMGKPTDRTVIYMLQDGENLYIAFKAYTHNNEPVGVLGGREDYVSFYVDPFGSKSNGYYFRINLSGQITVTDDGWILDNGSSADASWDGVWYRKVKIHDNYYFAEMKIPFKSIRYKVGLKNWYANFDRYIIMNNELDRWIPVEDGQNPMVSDYNTIMNIDPKVVGYHFELYPEGYFKTVRSTTDSNAVFDNKLSGSLNMKWDITSENTLNATLNPDFSQIEADPYSLNLSQFPVLLGERRPFFVEGRNIFRMNDLGDVSSFDPLILFYSRKVGKSIGYDAVPILGGLKFTGKSSDWDYGILSAFTDNYYQDTLLLEQRRGFGVARFKKGIFDNSEIGMLFSSTATGTDNYNAAAGADLTYRQGYNQFILQSAVSTKNGKLGYAFNSGFTGFIYNKIFSIADIKMISDSFDVSDIGYVPWAGLKRGTIAAGPYITVNKYGIRNILTGPGYSIIQEPQSNQWSHILMYFMEIHLQHNSGLSISGEYGPHNEQGINYRYKSVDASIWTVQRKFSINLGGNFNYSYNYNRNYIANNISSWASLYYSIIPRIAVNLNANYWVEFDPSNNIEMMVPRFRPTLNLFLSESILLSIFNETVAYTDDSHLSNAQIYTNKLGMLFSWNFSPKSWVYIAVNDNMEENPVSGDLARVNSTAAFKIKYLLYF